MFRNLDDNRAWLCINMKQNPLNNVKMSNRNTPGGNVPTETPTLFFLYLEETREVKLDFVLAETKQTLLGERWMDGWMLGISVIY